MVFVLDAVLDVLLATVALTLWVHPVVQVINLATAAVNDNVLIMVNH